MNFTNLHHQETPILIGNVWDVPSAKAAQQLNYQAIGTSSGAIASMLGYDDGEAMSFKELKYIVERITQSTTLPLTVDLEAGYSRNPSQIIEHIKSLADLGVKGINIEDSFVQHNKRTLLPSTSFSKILEQVCSSLVRQNIDLFINVRTDTFLLKVSHPIQATIERAQQYDQAGAQGLFVPCIEKEEDIAALIRVIALPLNVMCMPNLPNFGILSQLGVRRISMGNFVYNKLNGLLEQELGTILQSQSFKSLFA